MDKVSWDQIDKVFRRDPNELLSRLPDQQSIEVKRAREHLKLTEDYVKMAREKHRDQE